MSKAYKRMPVHRRVTKSMIPKPARKMSCVLEGHQTELLHGRFPAFAKKYGISGISKLREMNARTIRKRFRGEPIGVIDRLVSISLHLKSAK